MATRQTGDAVQERRILVLGSAPHSRLVRAYEWDQLPNDLNIADFDTVIMDFTPFANTGLAKGINIDRIPGWQQYARHLFSTGSEIVVIGSPAFQLGTNPYLLSTWWLPVQPHFIYEKGRETRAVHKGYEFYFDCIQEWSFYQDGFEESHPDFLQMYLDTGAPGTEVIRVAINPIAETRFGRPIAFTLTFQAVTKAQQLGRTFPNQTPRSVQSGEVIWLPTPTKVSSQEAVDLLLRQVYGLRFEKEPPKWIVGYSLPSEHPIEQVIHEKEAMITKLTLDLETAQSQLKQASRFRKLLYEQGEDVLEPIVRDAFRELGATVEDPKKKGREDGRLADPTDRNGMLEIKGRSGELKLSDVRELDNWVRDAMANEGWHGKGILVANLQCDTEPGKRKNIFPVNCLDAARLFGVSILTTSQLFRAIVDHQTNRLDHKKFWETVLTSVGPCKLPEL